MASKALGRMGAEAHEIMEINQITFLEFAIASDDNWNFNSQAISAEYGTKKVSWTKLIRPLVVHISWDNAIAAITCS